MHVTIELLGALIASKMSHRDDIGYKLLLAATGSIKSKDNTTKGKGIARLERESDEETTG